MAAAAMIAEGGGKALKYRPDSNTNTSDPIDSDNAQATKIWRSCKPRFARRCNDRQTQAKHAPKQECLRKLVRVLTWGSCRGAAPKRVLLLSIRIVNSHAGRVSGFKLFHKHL
jgi:hypothetical protein